MDSTCPVNYSLCPHRGHMMPDKIGRVVMGWYVSWRGGSRCHEKAEVAVSQGDLGHSEP